MNLKKEKEIIRYFVNMYEHPSARSLHKTIANYINRNYTIQIEYECPVGDEQKFYSTKARTTLHNEKIYLNDPTGRGGFGEMCFEVRLNEVLFNYLGNFAEEFLEENDLFNEDMYDKVWHADESNWTDKFQEWLDDRLVEMFAQEYIDKQSSMYLDFLDKEKKQAV